MDSVLSSIRAEAAAIVALMTPQVIELIGKNQARGRIYLLRRGKALPKDSLESEYLTALRHYIFWKVKLHHRLRGKLALSSEAIVAGDYAAEWRDKMTRLEQEMRGEVAEWNSVQLGHFDY